MSERSPQAFHQARREFLRTVRNVVTFAGVSYASDQLIKKTGYSERGLGYFADVLLPRGIDRRFQFSPDTLSNVIADTSTALGNLNYVEIDIATLPTVISPILESLDQYYSPDITAFTHKRFDTVAEKDIGNAFWEIQGSTLLVNQRTKGTLFPEEFLVLSLAHELYHRKAQELTVAYNSPYTEFSAQVITAYVLSQSAQDNPLHARALVYLFKVMADEYLYATALTHPEHRNLVLSMYPSRSDDFQTFDSSSSGEKSAELDTLHTYYISPFNYLVDRLTRNRDISPSEVYIPSQNSLPVRNIDHVLKDRSVRIPRTENTLRASPFWARRAKLS